MMDHPESLDIVFGMPLFRYHKDPTELKAIANEKYLRNKSIPVHGTPSNWDCQLTTDFENSQANIYSHMYDDIMKDFARDVGIGPNGRAEMHESWLNYYAKGENQEEHDHLPAFYSGIHYLQFNPDEHQAIQFANPMHQLFNCIYTCSAACRDEEDITDHYQFSRQWWWPEDVEEGDIIIFPSFLKHRVVSNESDEVRMSLAFNINTIKGTSRRIYCK